MPTRADLQMTPEEQTELVQQAMGLVTPMGMGALIGRGTVARKFMPVLKKYLQDILTPEAYNILENIGKDITLHYTKPGAFAQYDLLTGPLRLQSPIIKMRHLAKKYLAREGGPQSVFGLEGYRQPFGTMMRLSSQPAAKDVIAVNLGLESPAGGHVGTTFHEVGHGIVNRMPLRSRQELMKVLGRIEAPEKAKEELLADMFRSALLDPKGPSASVLRLHGMVK